MPEAREKEIRGQLRELSSSVQEKTVTRLGERLGELKSRIDRIPSPAPPPRTTLQIQGEADAERAWQNYLGYFLDPSAPHGLGNDALNQFLKGLSSWTDGGLPDHVSEEIEVVTEPTSDTGNRPDLLIRDPGQFFVCCELKLYSSESGDQTRRYVEDNQVGQVPKESFPAEGHHFVYIKRRGSEDATAGPFVNITWGEVQKWLSTVLADDRGRYPSRTTAQLSDFLDTIHQDMSDDLHLQTKQKKMQLYFEHLDAIQEARSGLEAIHEHERRNWRRRFLEKYQPDTWTEDWHCNSNIYGHFYRSEWRLDDGLNLSSSKVRMHFVHLIRDIESFEEGRLTVELRWPGGESKYKDRFKDLFTSDRFADVVDPALGKQDVTKAPNITRKNPSLTRKEYDVSRRELPESYYETLTMAVREHQQLAPAINRVLAVAIEEVDGETPSNVFSGRE
ncbi:MAG: PD-(D/E)XK nuclease family protein [Candidatus Bipolaricaulia bacterium]